jgi:hypothetical protein
MARNSAARTAHDLGLAAWFGGSLMGAIGVNGAANDVKDPTDRVRVAAAGWARWAPWNAVAIGAHLAAGAQIVRANRGRIGAQKGVAGASAAKTALTAAAIGATAYSGYLGQRVQTAGSIPAEGGVEPSESTPDAPTRDMQLLRGLQWAIPLLTGGIVLTNAILGEQQRPTEVARGALKRAGTSSLSAAAHPRTTAKAVRAAATQLTSS